ncbi:porin [Aquabacterium sp.]|uniref:porin n=1 Tax=Aquabacterium sp. TaxID=1872578 RepID=UPI002C38079B|nr:porin [Aquabacterium sp.]HSW05314.1 porin [Aquabacterium sp.]
MKHSLSRIGLAAALSLTALAASAQSNVTLYGRVNLTVENQKAGSDGSKTVLQNNSSRWGVRGSEDLGGGLKAGFNLESGWAADTGVAAATFFGRRSEVNLSGGFGTLRLGRYFSEAYFATADYVSNHNHDTGTSSDAFYAYLGRDANKIAYRLPEFAKDLSIEGAVLLHEGVTGQKNNYDFAVNYSVGGLQLGLGYELADTTTTKKNQVALRAFYSAGPFGFGGYVQRDKNAFGAGNRTNVRLSAMYTLDLSEFHVNVGSAGDTGNIADSDARQYTLGYNYLLSKRTKVYGFVTKIDDGKAGLYGGDFKSFAVGVRHNF